MSAGTSSPSALHAFENRQRLPTVVLPATLTEIEEEAFVGTAARRVVILVSCTAIGSRAFADAPALILVEIPGGNTSIADDAFDGCAALTILAPEGSDVQRYAEEHGFAFLALQANTIIP